MQKKEEVVVEEKEGGVLDSEAVVYEIGYIMLPSIAEEALGGEVVALKDSLSSLGAVFISDEYPKMIELAHEMSRSINNKKQNFSYGYFGWVKFDATTEQAGLIKSFLDTNEKLIRYLLIKTVRESTLSVKRLYTKTDAVKHKTKPEESLPIDEAVIDKEIEALVV